MKKIIIYTILCLLVGLTLTYYMFNQYNLEEAYNETDYAYFLEIGIYSSFEEMSNNVELTYYIYSEEQDGFHVYSAITKNNLEKLTNYFNNKNITIKPIKITIKNKTFIETLNQYDELLKTTDETKIIENIISQTLSKYEEVKYE